MSFYDILNGFNLKSGVFDMGLWGFLSICVIAGVIFVMYASYLDHKKELRKMELEAQKNNKEKVE
ncbi:hypothetical protein GCM10009123_03070 [Kangiella japonica]|uniref:DUF3149 domain-containing protein n=1 Tax=Kangiella japonica TaxID=647384 RepID=A0ABN0STT0_9GAMM